MQLKKGGEWRKGGLSVTDLELHGKRQGHCASCWPKAPPISLLKPLITFEKESVGIMHTPGIMDSRVHSSYIEWQTENVNNVWMLQEYLWGFGDTSASTDCHPIWVPGRRLLSTDMQCGMRLPDSGFEDQTCLNTRVQHSRPLPGHMAPLCRLENVVPWVTITWKYHWLDSACFALMADILGQKQATQACAVALLTSWSPLASFLLVVKIFCFPHSYTISGKTAGDGDVVFTSRWGTQTSNPSVNKVVGKLLS